ncbi:MAG TPA: hypothetical protein VF795_02060, partial [Desulfuromonadaceae bacterium]
MGLIIPFIMLPLLLVITTPVFAADISGLADCAARVFGEIQRTQKWSGKAPSGCSSGVRVERRPSGLFVTVWDIEAADEGWVRTGFSAGMGYGELSTKKLLARAKHDIMARAAHIGRCLDSIIAVNDPLDCRDRATKSYVAGEETGIEDDRLIWLDDNGRHTVVEYSSGNTTATPSP